MGKTLQTTEECSIGSWSFRFSREIYSLTEFNLKEAEKYVSDWQKMFPKGKTWVEENLGIHSLAIRFDCSINDGHLKLYEVEERPGGIGMMKTINSLFAQKLETIQRGWPIIKTLISPLRKNHDDPLWLEEIRLEDVQKFHGLLLIRAEPDEKIYQSFEGRSVSSLSFKGDKSYGVGMGLWEEVNIDNFEDLNWQKGFCLKEKQNSKSRGIEIYHPQKNQFENEGINGFSTKTRIKKVLESNGSMYCQPFIAPMKSPYKRPMIFRIFFLYNLQKMRYEYAGGFWNDRPNIKVMGAENAIIGLIN